MKQPEGAHIAMDHVRDSRDQCVASWQASPCDPTGPRFRIEDIYPCVDGGRYAVKRVAGESVEVWADIFREGHEVIAAAMLWRPERDRHWQRRAMTLHSNDRWSGSFVPPEPGWYLFAIEAWTDHFATWRKEFLLKQQAGQDVSLEAREGLALLDAAKAADPASRRLIESAAHAFKSSGDPTLLVSADIAAAMAGAETRADLSLSPPLPLVADRPRARAGAWYEMVPRSQSKIPGRHGTFDDCIARLPDIAALGFDVLYFPPIHPIGRTNRKGNNNALRAGPGDPGSPYAIGSELGGHDAVHPELGTLDDFRRLVEACATHDMEIALDFAIQCSPDHPWLQQHPEWFRRRADGTFRYAENPPKKYQDIVNPDFSGTDRIALWEALRDVIVFWIEQGVRIFRVDNPHTKPIPFWEWLIHDVQTRHPGVIFLAEAFTRPKIMKSLGKIGFTQSYSYFTWRTEKTELESYLRELTHYPEREYYRANFFVTTPDILPVQLQSGEPWMFKSRFALAAMLSSNYGIYNGFELIEHAAIPGKEEYADSEKYQIKVRDWNKPGNIKDYIARLNRIRRCNAALQQTSDLSFLTVDDPGVTGFVKRSVNGENAAGAAIALTGGRHEFWLHFGDFQIGPAAARRPVRAIENLVTGQRTLLEWNGTRVHIDATADPAFLFRCHA